MQAKDILRDLIKFDTYKDKENAKIINYIEKNLKNRGFKTEYKTKCLIMSIKEKCSLGFLGHTDTVKEGENWKINPLELKEVDGKLYGLGSCDMKGGLSAILKAVIDTEWEKMNNGIKLYFTYDEENNFRGIKEINNLNQKFPDNMIIGEPTNNQIKNGSKGLLELKIDFQGKSAHSSNPDKGINAIEKCLKFVEDIKKFYISLKLEKDNRFEIPHTTMNLGKIDGGKSINIVPDNCTIYIDYRVINDTHREKILKKIKELQKKYQYKYEIINDIKSFISNGKNVMTTNFITEASFIQAKNKYILGVGPITAHEANEYITIESLERLVEQYKQVINKFCL